MQVIMNVNLKKVVAKFRGTYLLILYLLLEDKMYGYLHLIQRYTRSSKTTEKRKHEQQVITKTHVQQV